MQLDLFRIVSLIMEVIELHGCDGEVPIKAKFQQYHIEIDYYFEYKSKNIVEINDAQKNELGNN